MKSKSIETNKNSECKNNLHTLEGAIQKRLEADFTNCGSSNDGSLVNKLFETVKDNLEDESYSWYDLMNVVLDTFNTFLPLLDGWDRIGEQLKADIIFDLVHPNLICNLLLEAKVAMPPIYEGTLISLYDKYYQGSMNVSKLSRFTLQRFPKEIQCIFGICKEKNRYKIRTQFPQLLMALVELQSILPFNERNNHITRSKDVKILKKCISAIKSEAHSELDYFIEYYLFERLFRISTKTSLFFTKKNKEKCVNRVLSPDELAKFHFSSPIVFFRNTEPANYMFYTSCVDSCFHIMALVSAYWFPYFQYCAKYYISKKKLTDYESLVDYIFPEPSADFEAKGKSDFFKDYKPQSPQENVLRRGKQLDDYNKNWCNFSPPGGFIKSAYQVRALKDWESEYSLLYLDSKGLLFIYEDTEKYFKKKAISSKAVELKTIETLRKEIDGEKFS